MKIIYFITGYSYFVRVTKLISILFLLVKTISAQPLSWHKITTSATSYLMDVFFVDSNNGWAVGDNGTIINTIDGGKTWSLQTSGTIAVLKGIFFISTSTGWAVGNNGVILSTTNGGSNWNPQTSTNTQGFKSVYFSSASIGCIGGYPTEIYKTTNGGNNWNKVFDYNSVGGDVFTIEGFSFNSASIGWSGGIDKYILKTTDGGSSWSKITLPSTYDVLDVFFSSSSTGWIVGQDGFISKTSNCGSNWVTQTSSTSNYLLSIFFNSDDSGWVVGEYGTCLYTTDGGTNWYSQSGFTSDLNSVFFVSATEGWIASSDGAVWTTKTFPPAIPASLTVTPGDRQVTLSWDQNTETDFQKYRIYMGNSSPATILVDSTLAIDQTTKMIGSLNNGQNYYFRVTAVNNDGLESDFSNEVNTSPVGLVAYYPFNGNANDESGNNHNGIIHNAIPAADRFENNNKAYSFNGSDAFIDCGNTHPANTNFFSISLWIKPSSQNIIGDPTIFGDAFSYKGFRVYQVNDKIIFECQNWPSFPSLIWPLTVSNLNKWIHIVGISNNGNYKLYIDDKLYENQDNNLALNGTYNLSIGKDAERSIFWPGSIDDIRLYDRILSEAEIFQLYANYRAPDTLIAEAGDRKVILKWSADRVSSLDRYRIYRDGILIDSLQITSDKDTLYVDNNVANYENYKYYITSIDTLGNESQHSDTISIIPYNPSPPSGFAIASETGKVYIHWDSTGWNYRDKMFIYRNEALIDSISVTSNADTIYMDTLVNYYQPYSYFIRSTDILGNSSISSDTLAGIPYSTDPPPGFNTLTGNKRIILKWDSTDWNYKDKIFIYRDEALIDSISLTSNADTIYMDTLVNYYQPYSYFIQSVDILGNSSIFSDTLSGIPYSTDSPPGFNTLTGNKRITLKWDSTDWNHHDKIFIYRDVVLIDSISVTSNADTIYMDTLVNYYRPYSYFIRSTDILGNSSIFSDTLSGIPYSTDPPPGFNMLTENKRNTLKWDSIDWNYHNKIFIYRNEALIDSISITSEADTVYVDTLVNDYQSYFYFIRSKDLLGNSSISSDTLSGIPYSTDPPSEFTTISGDKIVILKWGSSGWNYRDKIFIYRNNSLLDSLSITSNADTIYMDTQVNLYQPYSYFIQSTDILGNSSIFSDTLSGIPYSTDSPPGFNTLTGNKRITLKWDSTDWNHHDKIFIYRDVVLIDSISVTSNADTIYMDTLVNYYQPYSYFIRSTDILGNSSIFSDTLSGIPYSTVPPSGFTTISEDKIVILKWGFSGWNYRDKIFIYRNNSLFDSLSITSNADTIYMDTLVNFYKPYSYFILSKDLLGNLSFSSDTLMGMSYNLNPPAGFSVIPGQGKITLTWDSINWNYKNQVYIFRDLALTDSVLITSSADTFYLDKGLNNGQIYTYYIRSRDNLGHFSNYSDKITGSPLSFETGLIAWYPLNGNTYDESVYGNHGTAIGANPGLDRFGKIDSAYYFNGASDYIYTGANNILDDQQIGSIDLWFKTPSPEMYGNLIAYSTDGSVNSLFSVQLSQDKILFSVKHNTYTQPNFTGTTSILPNKWYHLIITCDGTNPDRTYLNGTEEPMVYNDGGSGANGIFWFSSIDGISTYDHFLSIGALRRLGAPEGFFAGSIDNIRVYDRVLSTSEILQHYANYYSPDTLLVETGDSQVTLRWSSERIAGLDRYRIFRDEVFSDSIMITGTADTVYNDTGLANYQPYEYYITSVDTLGNESQHSETVMALPPYNFLVDSRDNKSYRTIKIGQQTWMAENLAYLPSVSLSSDGSSIDPYYYVYDYQGMDINEAKVTPNYSTYGVLYNWPAAMNGDSSSNNFPSGVKGVCPTGWHLPSYAEWDTLAAYLGGSDIAGGKLKESGIEHWINPNLEATNETSFSGLPGGNRGTNGTLYNFGIQGYFWASSEDNPGYSWSTFLSNSDIILGIQPHEITNGFSVRCIKDISSLINYSRNIYCQADENPTPSIIGESGGLFSAPPEVIFSSDSTGQINLEASTPGGPYKINYTYGNSYQDTTSFYISIRAKDDASFSYDQQSYCQSTSNPLPVITGITGGLFSGPPELVFKDTATGEINLSSSTLGGPYSVTYTTPDIGCQNSDSFEITITTQDDANFQFDQNSYCQWATDPIPVIKGIPGGEFSGPSEIVFRDAATGEIDLASSIQGGPYDITYTTPSGACQNSFSFALNITASDDASFTYDNMAYCMGSNNPVASITGVPGGTFTDSSYTLVINPASGIINMINSPAGSYTIYYTTPNSACQNSSSAKIKLLSLPSVKLNGLNNNYCADISPFNLKSDLDPVKQGESEFFEVDGDALDGTLFNPAFYSLGTHMIQCIFTDSAGCTNKDEDTIILLTPDEPWFAYSPIEYYKGDPNPYPSLGGTQSGIFSGSLGIVFINNLSGEIDLDASLSGTFNVTYTTPGPDCPRDSMVEITIFPKPVQTDKTPPEISIIDPPQWFQSNASHLNLDYTISDSSGIQSAQIIFKRIESDDSTISNLIHETANNWYYNLYPVDFGDLGLRYYVIATDSNNNTSIDKIRFIYINKVKGELSIKLTGGSQQEAYQIVSFPLNYGSPVMSQLIDNFGAYNPKKWRLFHYITSDDANVEMGGQDSLGRGLGYWLILKDSMTVRLQGGSSLQDGKPFKMSLHKNWNQIGNPYPFAIRWDSVLNYNRQLRNIADVARELCIYNPPPNTNYDHVKILKAFEGAFVKSNSEINLEIPLLKNSTAQLRSGSRYDWLLEQNFKFPEWYLPIDIYNNKLANRLGGIGMSYGAAEGPDEYDRWQIPRFMNYLDINFTINKDQPVNLSTSMVPVSDHYRWDFEAETNTQNIELSLKWNPGYISVQPGKIMLFNPVTCDLVDMEEHESYTFLSGNKNPLSILFGDDQFIKEQIEKESSLFADPFPNPFEREITIQGIAPVNSVAQSVIKIYNLQGQLVFNSDHYSSYQNGIIKFSWDGRNLAGNEVSNGLYNMIITLKEKQGYTKMISKKIIKN